MPTYISPLDNYRISSGFGPRDIGAIGSKNHMGIDLAAPKGTPVLAPADLKITGASYSGGYGNLITGVDSSGLTHQFAHLSSMSVKPGDIVLQGQNIGGVGNTGNSTGNHLHYGIKDAAGKYINPKFVLDQAKKLGNDAIQKGKDALVKAALLSNPITAPIAAAQIGLNKLVGGDGDDCGINIICHLRKWLKDSDFFVRMAMVIVAIIFLAGAFVLFSRGQVTTQLTKALK